MNALDSYWWYVFGERPLAAWFLQSRPLKWNRKNSAFSVSCSGRFCRSRFSSHFPHLSGFVNPSLVSLVMETKTNRLFIGLNSLSRIQMHFFVLEVWKYSTHQISLFRTFIYWIGWHLRWLMLLYAEWFSRNELEVILLHYVFGWYYYSVLRSNRFLIHPRSTQIFDSSLIFNVLGTIELLSTF